MILPVSTLPRLRAAQRVFSQLSKLPTVRSFPITRQTQCRHFIGQLFRAKPPRVPLGSGTTSIKHAYGERVLVYYAGRRIVFVATLKLTTIFLCVFCTFIAAPSVGINTEYGYWAPVCIVLAGAVPLAFMQYTSPPYVTHAFLHLPPWARQSQEVLNRYARNLPPSAQLSLGTIRLLGRPQLRTVILSELTYNPKRLGCANWEWKPQFEDKKNSRDFYVDQNGSPAKVPVPGIMEEVISFVKEQTRQNLVKKNEV